MEIDPEPLPPFIPDTLFEFLTKKMHIDTTKLVEGDCIDIGSVLGRILTGKLKAEKYQLSEDDVVYLGEWRDGWKFIVFISPEGAVDYGIFVYFYK